MWQVAQVWLKMAAPSGNRAVGEVGGDTAGAGGAVAATGATAGGTDFTEAAETTGGGSCFEHATKRSSVITMGKRTVGRKVGRVILNPPRW
jgi:hypothetical protein